MASRVDGNLHVDGTITCKRLDIPAGNIEAADLGSNLKTGRIDLPLATAREVVTNAIPNTAANGGLLASDTTPVLERVNGATDPQLRIKWAASNSDPITFSVLSPNDLDNSASVTVSLRGKMSGSTDTPTITVSVFEDVGGSEIGGATGALSSTIGNVTRTFTATATSASPKAWTITLTPGTQTTDAVELYGIQITYTRTT